MIVQMGKLQRFAHAFPPCLRELGYVEHTRCSRRISVEALATARPGGLMVRCLLDKPIRPVNLALGDEVGGLGSSPS